jgi:hemerythrin-like metal-binding protein
MNTTIFADATRIHATDHPFVWNETLATGIGLFDHDHHLISVALGILDTCLGYGSREGVQDKTINFLHKHTHLHFLREEMVMEKLGYPNLDEHIQSHGHMRNWMGETMPKLGTSLTSHSRAIIDYLHEWWREHTRTHDSEYAGFLLPHAAQARAIIAEYNLV